MAKRLLALAAALAMVVGAFVVRDRRSDGTGTAGGTPAIVICARELSAVCETLRTRSTGVEFRVEDVGTTIEALSAASFEPRSLSGWLVPRPLPQLVDERRARAGLPLLFDGDGGAVLARSPVAIAVWGDRADVLAGRCGGVVSWTCIGDVAGRPWADAGGQAAWGTVKPGHPPADRSVEGLFTIAQASASELGRADLASNDLDDSEFRLWFTRLQRAVPTFTPPAGTPVAQMLFTGPAAFDAAGTLEASAGPTIASSRERQRLRLVVPAPIMTADVVLVTARGPSLGRARDLLTSDAADEAFATAGWRVPGRPLATGVDPALTLPDGDGLPPAGTLDALRSLWVDVTR